MNIKIQIFLTLILFVSICNAQNRISGFVKDKTTGEALIGATISELKTGIGNTSDNTGFFTLNVIGQSVQVSFIGYQSKEVNIPSSADSLVQVLLEVSTDQIATVNIVRTRVKQFSTVTLSKAEMESIPAMGAKPDVLKTLQLMPGIQPALEGSSQLVVRGGSPGENLYLFDGVPVIYVNHIGGFTSVFNPDMINDLEVYKGGFPAKYGGKLSSIVNITQREGNKSKTTGSLSLGVTDASFVVEGPMLDKKASFIITGRKTMYDALLWTASALGGGNSFYLWSGFHDVNAKFSWRPDHKNSFHFNLYQGDDYLKYWTKHVANKTEKSKQAHVWGNWLASARWNRVVNSNLTSENILSYSRYRLKYFQEYTNKITQGNEKIFRENLSSVADISFRSNWNWQPSNNWKLQFGGSVSLQNFIPNKVLNTSSTISFEDDNAIAKESALYFSNSLSLWKFLYADIGLRAAYYSAYDFSKWKLEPRISVNVDISPNHTLNFSYQDIGQNAHLLLTSGVLMSSEMWIPVGKKILPANSTQYQFGWKAIWMNGLLQSEINFYRKNLSCLSTYKEGYTSLLGDGGWRSKILSGGLGHSKGLEIFVKKSKGDWTGFAGYTFSKTTRQFAEINKNTEYHYEFDRPHTFSVNIGRQFNDQISVSATWVYQTGMPFTPALGQQLDYNNEVAFIYGERNSAPMIDYHRLDLGMKYKKKSKRGRRAEWTFSIYNVYSRRNAYFYYYDTKRRDLYDSSPSTSIKLFKANMFPIIPTASYRVYFDGKINRIVDDKKKSSRQRLKERMKNYLYYEK
jgi:hypothetical protein